MSTTLLETCRIAPPPHTVADQTLPLTFLDLMWVPFHPIRRLLFFELQNPSKSYFSETLTPNLKQSLSLALKHFFPLAGKIIYPLNTDKKPSLRYETGDSVSVTFVESSHDFDYLIGNHPRDADKFYDFIPLLPLQETSNQKLLEVLAIQVTLFPGRGVCIGLSNHHGVGDASSIVSFIRSWASINKNGEIGSESLPVFNRELVKYPVELDSVFLDQIKKIPFASPGFPTPTNRVRATYVFTPSELARLKNLVKERIPGLGHVSSFVVMAAYVWSSLAKSIKLCEDNEPEFFLFAVDARVRVNPPVPGNYFGNCLAHGLAKIEHNELVGEGGFFSAAEAIAEEIKNRVIKNEDIFGSAENWLEEVGNAFRNRILSVSGSARVDLYSADFGWGRARKMESLSIDREKYAMTLCKAGDCEGGLEVGLSLPKEVMEAFDAVFCDGLKGE